MAIKAWWSQTYVNSFDGGSLLVLPHELLGDWNGEGEAYERVIDTDGPFDFFPVGTGFGVFASGPEGDILHEANWLRMSGQAGEILVGWNEKPSSSPRRWVESRLKRPERLSWQRHEQVVAVESGVLFLLHAFGRAIDVRLAPAGGAAKHGEAVPIGLGPGPYQVETTELFDEDECIIVELCRWLPAVSEADV
jgi:hypothetical protein